MRLILGLLLSLISTGVLAQNPTCPTRPPGTTGNACASLDFVFQNSLPASLTQNFILVGSAGNLAVGVPVSGDCTIVSAGALTCTKTNGMAFATLATKTSPVCADLTNSSPSCSTDTTNATNISTGTLANARLVGVQNTVKGAAASAVETDLSVPGCSAASSALTWTTNTGFGCNTVAVTPGAWSAFTPSITCGTATFTVNSARSSTFGKTTSAAIDFTITAIGTCVVTMNWNLPNTSNSAIGIVGREIAINGKGFNCTSGAGATNVACTKADDSNFLVNEHFQASGVYENQ